MGCAFQTPGRYVQSYKYILYIYSFVRTRNVIFFAKKCRLCSDWHPNIAFSVWNPWFCVNTLTIAFSASNPRVSSVNALTIAFSVWNTRFCVNTLTSSIWRLHFLPQILHFCVPSVNALTTSLWRLHFLPQILHFCVSSVNNHLFAIFCIKSLIFGASNNSNKIKQKLCTISYGWRLSDAGEVRTKL